MTSGGDLQKGLLKRFKARSTVTSLPRRGLEHLAKRTK